MTIVGVCRNLDLLANYPKFTVMNKQTYRTPEFRMYGNISVMTQAMATGKQTDNGKNINSSKTA